MTQATFLAICAKTRELTLSQIHKAKKSYFLLNILQNIKYRIIVLVQNFLNKYQTYDSHESEVLNEFL